MKGLVMETLFVLIQGLASLTADSKGVDVQKYLDMEFEKSPSSHEYVTFFGNKNPVVFGDGLTIRVVDIAVRNSSAKLVRITLEGLAQYCITKEQLQTRFGGLELIEAPSSPAPIAETVWRVMVKGKRVGFGFANQARDCLESVTVHFDS